MPRPTRTGSAFTGNSELWKLQRRWARRWSGGLALALAFLCSLISAAPVTAGPIQLDFRARTIFGRVTSGANHLVDVYETPNGLGIDYLDPDKPVHPLTVGDAPYFNFFNVLNLRFPTTNGWKFTGDARTFSAGSLKIHTYDAIGRATRVGADIDVEYRPTPTTVDPTASMHWIQVVSNNHNITSNPGHGNLDNTVDLAGDNRGVGGTPYYDTGTPVVANSRNLLDTPRRSDVELDHNWQAVLFLASGPNAPGTAAAPAQVTIFNDAGIIWGWRNRFFRGLNLLAFHNAVDNEIIANLPAEEIEEFHREFHDEIAAVPEPSTIHLVACAGASFIAIVIIRRPARRRK